MAKSRTAEVLRKYLAKPLTNIGAGALGAPVNKAADSLESDPAPAGASADKGGFVEGMKKGAGIALDIGRAIVSSAVGVAGKILDNLGGKMLGEQFAKVANFLDASTDKSQPGQKPVPLSERALTAAKDGAGFAVDVARAAVSSALNMAGGIAKFVFSMKTNPFAGLAEHPLINPSTHPLINPSTDKKPAAAPPVTPPVTAPSATAAQPSARRPAAKRPTAAAAQPTAAAAPPTKPVLAGAAEPPARIQTAVAGSPGLYLQTTPGTNPDQIKNEFEQFSKGQDGKPKPGFSSETKKGPPEVMTLTFPDRESMNKFIKENLVEKGLATLPGTTPPKTHEEKVGMMDRIGKLQGEQGSVEDKAAQAKAAGSSNSSAHMTPLASSATPSLGAAGADAVVPTPLSAQPPSDADDANTNTPPPNSRL